MYHAQLVSGFFYSLLELLEVIDRIHHWNRVMWNQLAYWLAKNLEYLDHNTDIVNLFSLDEEILHISGSLIPAHTGSVSWLDGDGGNPTTERYCN